ncbi:hypothetical protein PNOK_0631800 [Pyrrhoderma noxium]|uniref:Uncharacterized protein n=1 Tax=Pyrrhoderma noxium TaxID=2282107 RepID=A0A286UDX9_9AGAM|nr:hypothetical protein PNOK_0631800 [Pyrrhoderma noxium]
MKVFAILCTLIAGAVAQTASVTEPRKGDTWTAGGDHLFTVARTIDESTVGVTEIGIAIAIKHCSQDPCEDSSQALGAVLYAGTFNPVMDYDLGYSYENYTLTVPDGIQSGPAVISVAHASLINGGPSLFSEVVNTTITIA